MPHAARPLPSWLIFDVRQHPALRTIITSLILLSVLNVYAGVELTGVIVGPKQTLFAVRVDGERQITWLSFGENIAGFTVTSYDPATEALTLRKEAETMVIRLPESRIQSAVHNLVVYSSETLAGIDFARALARSGDTEIAEMTLQLDRKVVARLALAKELEAARTADITRVGELTRLLQTETELEQTLARRLIEVAHSKRPNKSPEPTPTAVTPRAIDAKSK